MDKTFKKVMQECGISIIDDAEYRAEYQRMIDEAVRIHTEYSYSKEAAIAVAIYYKRAKSKIQEKLRDSEFIIEETSIDKQLLSYLDTEQKNILLNAVQEYYKQLVNDMRHFFEDEGVIINGVKWATRNIDAPCVFAPTPESSGMFYQWNRKLGWAATDQFFNSNGGYTDSWDNTVPTGTIWEKNNDPSPLGWRLPTTDEINKLLDSEKVLSELAFQNDVEGRKFTDKITGNSIFLPEAGYFEYIGEVFNQLNNQSYLEVKRKLQGHCGCYWTGTTNNSVSSYGLFFNCHGTQQENVPFKREYALPIRCVAK